MSSSIDFNWNAFEVALSAKSSVDLQSISVKNKAQAEEFLLSYGYDSQDPIVKEELWRMYFQSVSFLKTHLLEKGEQLPESLLVRSTQNEITKLLIEVSASREKESKTSNDRSVWLCAILRVMHVISHLDNDIRLENFNYARQQIFSRFDRHIKEVSRNNWRVGEGKESVTLLRYMKKLRKDRNSTIIKLLAKPNTMAEEIYDRLGIRFVTETKLDCYRLLNIFFNLGIISYVNINPTRSKNDLYTMEELRKAAGGEIIVESELAKVDEEKILRNSYSSPWFNAVQITCRQLIKAPDPTYKFWESTKQMFRDTDTLKELKKLPVALREFRTFYYPFEIQIMDKESYKQSLGGRSRHREYKLRQRALSRNRVLGG